MKSSKYLAIAIAVIALIWIGSGFLLPSSEEPAATMPANSKDKPSLMEVRVRVLDAEPFANDVLVTGRTQASKKVTLRAETSGQIEEILKEEGAVAEQGDVLAKIEIRNRAAKVKETKERVNQRQIEYNAAKSLEDKGFNSKVRLAQASADLEDAKAALKEAEVELSKVNIISPFDGLVYVQEIERGDFVSVGDSVFTVVDLDPIELVGFVSERNIDELEPGKIAHAEFLNGAVVAGRLSYVAPAANEQTRTFRVEMSVPNENLEIKEGMTAKMRIPVAMKLAHKISPSVLSLSDQGEIGVKIVSEGDIAKFVPIKILSDRPDFMWVHGLPERVNLITVGQDFVGDGQKVKPVLTDSEGLL